MAGKIKQSPKMPAETRQQQLLHSACKLFVKKGFRATTTEEIARKVGLTKGALYFHFKSKEDILLELMKSMVVRQRAVFEEEKGSIHDYRDFYRVLTSMHARKDCHDSWEMADLWIQAMRIPRIKKYLTKQFQGLLAEVVPLIRDAGAASDVEPGQLAIFALALHDGLGCIDMILPDSVDLDAQMRLLDGLIDGDGSKPRRKRSTRKKQ